MADNTRTDQRTRTAGAEMREGGMPQGQAPVPHQQGRRMTAAEQRKHEEAQQAAQMKGALFAAVEQNRLEIESFLGVFGIGYDVFLAGLTVFLAKQQREQPNFFDKLHVPSFIEALTRIAMNGLMPDGKEAAIAAYMDRDLGLKVAQPMFMRDGFVKVLWRTGMVKSINDQVVTMKEYETGHFEYEEGDQGFIRHKMDLLRKDTDPVAAAYCVIELQSGGVMREVVPKDELDKMAKMSKSPARQAWQHQMHRKGAIRRIMGKMPREKGIVQLLQHDDETYRSLSDGPPAEIEIEDGRTTDRRALFGSKPIRRKRQADQEIEQTEMDAIESGEAEDAGDASPQGDPRDGDDISHEMDASDQGEDQGEEAATDQPFILQAVLSKKNGLQQFDASQVEFWYGDISQKMKALKDDPAPLREFWRINRPFVEEAGRNGHGEYAVKLMLQAKDLGLIEGAHRE